MSISVSNLESIVLTNSAVADNITIISGYYSADVLEDIAKIGKPTTFYYGMYQYNGLSVLQQTVFSKLEAAYPNLTINIVFDYHVHTKCYLFTSSTKSVALVGSANCSMNGLLSDPNCEMLTDITDPSLILDLNNYIKDVDSASKHFDDPAIVTYSSIPAKKRSRISTKKGRIYSGNPFIDNIPLYVYEKGKKVVKTASGLNWGLQKGNAKKASPYAEAYIGIGVFDLKYNGAMFPICGAVGTGSGGKSTRRLNPVTVTWDDGTVMKMLFQGTQEYPRRRNPGDPYMIYPKQLSTDKGGIFLGEYLRKRMGIPGRKLITYADLKKYKRDYITLTYINSGNYEADFSH